MRRTSVLLVLLGLLFVYIRMPAAGLRDMFIDAVGYLIVFNGIRGLRHENGGFTLSMWVCLVLVPVCAVEFFIEGNTVLTVARRALELALYAGLFASFMRVFKKNNGRLAFWLCVTGVVICAAGAVISVVSMLLAYTQGALYNTGAYYLPGAGLLVVALVLARYARLPLQADGDRLN